MTESPTGKYGKIILDLQEQFFTKIYSKQTVDKALLERFPGGADLIDRATKSYLMYGMIPELEKVMPVIITTHPDLPALEYRTVLYILKDPEKFFLELYQQLENVYQQASRTVW